LAGVDAIGELRDALPSSFGKWSPLNRAAYLEMTTLLSSYLLNTQGERMGMAHGVEGRFPFLDHRLFEYAAALPTSSKLLGLKEKNILKRWARDVVPPSVVDRHKQPYRAPDAPAFFGDGNQPYVDEMLSEESIRRAGIFDPAAVSGLVRRGRAGKVSSFAENQAFVAILSTQLWYDTMIASVTRPSTNFPHVRVPATQSAA
jgi:asparagine synthase (glutamine-hydrolysing)